MGQLLALTFNLNRDPKTTQPSGPEEWFGSLAPAPLSVKQRAQQLHQKFRRFLPPSRG